mgnify:CR=1 FL=1
MQFVSDPQCRLYVGNISFCITEEDVRDMFNTIGGVKDVYLPRVHRSRRHKGYGFVEMNSNEEAVNAISQLHKVPDIGGRVMIVRFADIRKEK